MVNGNLPEGWRCATLGEIADLVGGGTPSREHPEYFTGNIVWLTPTEIPHNRVTVVSNSREKITQEGLKKSSARLLPKGTVLMTSRASIGYVAIAGKEVTTNQGFASFICKDGVYNYFLAYWLLGNTDYFIEQATGTTFKEIIKSKLRNFPFPLPPLTEQERIIAKIEELFTQLDAGVASLKRVKVALKRYKASLLKAACEGWLVPQDKSDEPAEELLRRLGREPLEGEGLPELPDGWCRTRVGDIFTVALGGTPSRSKPEYWNGDIPWVSSSEVANCHIKCTRERITKLGLEHSNAKLNPIGSVLLAMIGEGKTRGQAAILDLPSTTNQNVAGILVSETPILSDWVFYWFLSRYEQTRKSGSGGMQYALNAERIKNFTLPLSPLAEQHRIVAEVERRLSVMGEVEAAVGVTLARAERLRQAILKRAFEGKL